MKEVSQTKLHDPKGIRNGNCFAAVVASLLELDIEDVPNVETLFDLPDNHVWAEVMTRWLSHHGHEWHSINREDVVTDELYLVVGKSPRGVTHVCIYKNGVMVWDPHPSRSGLITEDRFEVIKKITN